MLTALGGQNANAINAFDVEVNSGVGDQRGTLAWHIAGGTDGPNILSELTYKDVNFRVYQVASSIKINQGDFANTNIFFSYKNGVATAGTVQDSDYGASNRSQEYSRSMASATNSEMNEFDMGIGYRFRINAYQTLQPSVAYFRKQQFMRMSEGVQVVDMYNSNNLGPFRNTLNSEYDATWQGMWLGLNWAVTTPNHHLGFTFKQYFLNFSSVADWNLRSDFAHPKSFEQSAFGFGMGLEVSYRYQVSNLLSLWLNWTQEDWKTQEGKDTVFFADGTEATGQLNEASWKASGLVTGLVLQF